MRNWGRVRALFQRTEVEKRKPIPLDMPYWAPPKIATRTSARSNLSVIPARVSGAREESRIPLEDGGEGPGFFARQLRARMTEQEIEQDRNCHYDLQSSLGSSVIARRCAASRHLRV